MPSRRISDAEYDLLKLAVLETRAVWETKALASGSAYDRDRLERIDALLAVLFDHKGMEKDYRKPKRKSGGYTHGKRKGETDAV